MSADFIIARNAEPGSRLPYLLRVPLAPARPTPADVRRWASVHDIGRIPAAVMDQYLVARGRGET